MTKKYILIILVSVSFVLLSFCGKHNDNLDMRAVGRGKAAGKTGNRPAVRPACGKGHQQRLRHRRRLGRNSPVPPPREAGQTTVTLSDEEESKIRIKTVLAAETPIRSTLKAMGKVLAAPGGKAIVGYAFPGRIVKLHAAIGQRVKKGDPLVTLECEEVGNAKSAYFTAFTQYSLAQQDFQREERLFKKDIGARKDYLEAKARFDIAKSSLGAAEKKLHVMGFSQQEVDALRSGKNITPYITLNAPITGRVAENNAVLGAGIEPASVIMIILDPAHLCIDAGIYEKDLAKIKTGQEVRISVPAYPGETFVGRLCYIGDMVHPETRTITVRTRVANKDFKLKPGMFADIAVLVDQRKKALTVPIEAVLDELDRKIVFVRDGDRYVCRPVKVGPKFNGYIEIAAGLKKGESVVIEGNYQLKSRLYQESIIHGDSH